MGLVKVAKKLISCAWCFGFDAEIAELFSMWVEGFASLGLVALG